MKDHLLKKYQEMAMFEGVELIAFDQQGRFDEDTPLHVACFYGAVEDVKQMLNEGVKINIGGDIGNTPLHSAVVGGHVDVVKLLIASGADPELENDYGDKPIDMINSNADIIGPLLHR